MKKIIPQNLKGFRDFLPKEMAVKNRLISVIKGVFESFGFLPLETPALEYAETLLGKYGEEADRLVYKFKDRGEREVTLRYDLTVPLARVVAQYPNLPKPFKRYQIAPVWRAEKPQKGRYREFTQCDIDIVGTTSPLADAEVITIISETLTRIGLKDFTIRVNSRDVLFDVMRSAGVPKEKISATIRSIDKLDKVPEAEVKDELAENGMAKQAIAKIFSAMKNAEPDEVLGKVIEQTKKMGVRKINFDPTLARGLDYYTGPIYEATVAEAKIGSIAGGGRYDKLIGIFLGTDVPACGVSFGLDRLADVILENKLWGDLAGTATQVLVTVMEDAIADKAIEIANELRAGGINAEIYLDSAAKLDKQLKYADKKGIPLAVIFGSDEVKKKTAVLKNLKSRKQKEITFANLLKEVEKMLRK